MRWDPDLQVVLSWTAPYLDDSQEIDLNLKSQWTAMIDGCAGEWARLVGKHVESVDNEVVDIEMAV